jgi:hypothetical protein
MESILDKINADYPINQHYGIINALYINYQYKIRIFKPTVGKVLYIRCYIKDLKSRQILKETYNGIFQKKYGLWQISVSYAESILNEFDKNTEDIENLEDYIKEKDTILKLESNLNVNLNLDK